MGFKINMKNNTKAKISQLCLWGLLSLGIISCEKGLPPVSGIEGQVRMPIDSITHQLIWPDSLHGAFVVVVEFTYPFYTSLDSFFAHLVAYSDPLDTSRVVQDYFIQLKSGIYVVGAVGIKVPVSQIVFMPRDSLKTHPEYFVPIGLFKEPASQFPLSSVNVKPGEITSGIDLSLDYNIELPFK